MLKKLSARIWLSSITVAWGIVRSSFSSTVVRSELQKLTRWTVTGHDLHGIRPELWRSRRLPSCARSVSRVLAHRHWQRRTRELVLTFLPSAEAGLFPGVVFYLTMYYPRHLCQFRIALFFGAATVAGAFSGLLAYAIGFMNGVGGYSGWRWIFILEGLLSKFGAPPR